MVVKAIADVISVITLEKTYNLIISKKGIAKRIYDNHNPVLGTVCKHQTLNITNTIVILYNNHDI